MTTTFEEQLAKIKGQAPILETSEEKAVEVVVVLPLLKQLGWDTEDLKQIYPQKPMPASTSKKVDFDLQSNGASRVFIEVKRWNHLLNDEDEKQLRTYCLAGKPSLAALTNGRQWRLYLPPLRSPRKGQNPDRQFLAFDITNEPAERVENHFTQFLAHDRLLEATVKKTVNDATREFKKKQADATVMEALAEVWKKLATDDNALRKTVRELADRHNIQPDEDQIERFIRENRPLVNQISGPEDPPKPPKPVSFTLSPNDEALIAKKVKRQWNDLLLGVCLLMHERHTDDFEKKVLEIPESFSNFAGTLGWEGRVGDTGIYFRKGGAGYVKEVCYEVVSKFGYPRESLTIEEK